MTTSGRWKNALDPAHNEYVHTTHIDKQEDNPFKIPDLELINHEWGTGFHIEMPAPPMFEEKMADTSGLHESSIFHIYAGYHGVSSFWTFIEPTPKFLRRQYFYETPVEPGKTKIFVTDMRNAMLDAEDDIRMLKMDKMVANEDGRVLWGIRPVLQPANNIKENFVPSDKHVAHYRETIRDYEARGWRIDSEKVERNRMTTAYAIPCPARREKKNWTLDSIPLVAPKTGAATNKIAKLEK